MQYYLRTFLFNKRRVATDRHVILYCFDVIHRLYSYRLREYSVAISNWRLNFYLRTIY